MDTFFRPFSGKIKLAHLIEEQANCYGEDIKRLMGITSARLGIKTRLQAVGNCAGRHP